MNNLKSKSSMIIIFSAIITLSSCTIFEKPQDYDPEKRREKEITKREYDEICRSIETQHEKHCAGHHSPNIPPQP